MRKVYIPELPTRFDRLTQMRIPTIDLNDAASYGSFVSIISAPMPRKEALELIKIAAREIDAQDYIMAVGDVVFLALLLAQVLRKNGRALLLRWDRITRTYHMEEIAE
jgi:NTP pyrophosphatase (non-canonical NTP hydrolase)